MRTSRMLIYLLAILSFGSCARRCRRLVKPYIKNNNKFFMRLTLKNNVFPPAILFAYGAGFRMNWDMAPPSSRDLKHLLKDSLDRTGLNGEDCFRRAVCEVRRSRSLKPGIVEKLLNLFFLEEDEHEGRGISCLNNNEDHNEDWYERCPISLPNLSAHLIEQALTPTT